MTIEQLGDTENELLFRLTDINKSIQTLELDKRLESIFESYNQIHQAYAELADRNDEALKRGLFIQWYAWTEPSFNSGISELDPQSEQKIIKQIVTFHAEFTSLKYSIGDICKSILNNKQLTIWQSPLYFILLALFM